MAHQPIDSMLDQAGVLASEYDDFDQAASLERIARRAVKDTAAALDDRARRAHHAATGGAGSGPAAAFPLLPAGPSRIPDSRHDQAAARLERLAVQVVRDGSAVKAMSRLVDDASIDPAGALVFACLLYLADHPAGAQFWWQFAAGSGIAAAASCLSLHHLQHAEPRAAVYWQHQALTLQETYGPHPDEQPLVETAEHDYYSPGTPEACVAATFHTRRGSTSSSTPSSGRWWLVTSPLADAVRHLPVISDDEYGPVPRPNPRLADELAAATT